MSELIGTSAACIARIREILTATRNRALQSVNATMIAAYWEIGREIVEEEQRGAERAEYGAQLLVVLAERLSTEFGKGFGARNLRYIRQFYLTFPDRRPALDLRPDSLLREGEIWNLASSKSPGGGKEFSPTLSWTHYRVLMRVTRPEARDFYEAECARSRWSVAELERQIASLLFERLARSRDKEGVLALAREGHQIFTPADLVKDPYVLEFAGFPEGVRWLENDLEQALIDRLQHFLLELGKDLFFVARQKRLTIEGDHFYVDLVFYHRTLRCFLLVDLKVGRLTQQDIGQMLLYTGYYDAEERNADEGPAIGLILCTDKNEAVVRYTLGEAAKRIFASRYQLHLPTEKELAEELRRERETLLSQTLPETIEAPAAQARPRRARAGAKKKTKGNA